MINFIKVFIFLAAVIFAVWAAIWVFTNPVQASFTPHLTICHVDGQSGNSQTLTLPLVAALNHLKQHGQDYKGACKEDVTPTVTPTPTIVECEEDCEEVTPTPTPPCLPADVAWVLAKDEVNCEPTPTEEATPSATPTPEGKVGDPAAGEGKHNEVVCNGVTVDAPKLQGFAKTSDTSVLWKWWKSTTEGIDYQVLEYGYEQGNYPYAVIVDKDASQFEIGALEKGKVRWARVGAFKDGCSAFSQDLDP